jgi:vancomycin resistance protein YoaR
MTDQTISTLPQTEPVPTTDGTVVVHAPGRSRLRFGLAFVTAVTAALVIGVGALYAYDLQFRGRVLPGVHVGSVDLSGLSPDEAAARLHQAYDYLGDGQAVLVAGDQRVSIDYGSFGRGPDVDAMVLEAMSVGRGGNGVERAIANARTAFRGVTLAPIVRHDPAALARQVEILATRQYVFAQDAKITQEKAAFTVVAGSNGRRPDAAPAIAELGAILARVDAPKEVTATLPVIDVEPHVTTAEATAARLAATRIAVDVKIVDGKATYTINGATIAGWIAFRQASDGGYEPIIDSARLKTALAPIAKKIVRPAKNATFAIKDGKVVGVIPSVAGRAMDVDETAARIGELLATRAAGGADKPIEAVLTTATPNLSTAAAEAAAPKMKLISKWTTYFPIGIKNNFGANIWIPALDIDGTVVGPGETFDFWKTIGPITRARGYGLGGAIINGKTEPQGALAGGICSCSTTLFNAALRAGFDMGARRNHYYYIDRYPLGLDATVFKSASGAVQTMSWTNDTANPVLIRGYKIRSGSRGYVKFELYSVPTGRTVSFSTPIVKNIRRASDTIVYTTTLAPGVRKRIEFPVDGKDVWVTRTVRDSTGRIIHQETYYSHYARITGIVLVGKAAVTTASTASPSPS